MAPFSYAEVAVDAAVGLERTFSYSIPSHLSVQPGQLVWVPFGRQTLQGIVMDLAPVSPVAATRDILQAVEPAPLLGPVQLRMGRWLSRYYRCSLFSALSPLLPPGFEGQVRSRLTAAPEVDSTALGPAATAAVQVLAGKPHISERDFLKLLGRNGSRELNRLVEKGVIHRKVTMPRPRVAPRYEAFLVPPRADNGGPREDLTQRQQNLLTAVRTHSEHYPARLANKEFGSGVAQSLFDKGLVGLEWLRIGGGLEPRPETRRADLTLTAEQADALAEIEPAINDPTYQPRSFLLHGVTGSGKTEVYLRAIDHVVRRGRQAIFLVPEISLTPQTLERVNAWFPGRVALLHSRLTPRQQFDQWWDILEGKYDVVVGPRSALFAPVENLGLIVIDEEHEWTYKQVETHPLYHARTAAMELSSLTGAPVVMGSATPDVETYYQATRGQHRLLELPRRVGRPSSNGSAGGPAGGLARPAPGLASGLASVQVCDMRLELREGNREIFSRKLAAGLKDCVGREQQAILFLNRRGAASIVQCRDCGYVVNCRRCSVALTYHLPDARLLCHRCNRRSAMPRSCQQCGGGHIRQLGAGTQRVVEEVMKLLPGVRADRLDADATRSGQSLELAMQRLASGETQVLVGTQMVAKGLDVPNVTLVGVVLADIGLFLPDFRAGERIFGLLCQVAGRAGRGASPGRVFVQTYNPDHYAIQAAAAQDYAAMYAMEIESRREMGNPPFNQMVHLVYQDADSRSGQRQAHSASRELVRRADARGLTDVEVVGPAPGIPERLRGRYRWHLLLRGPRPSLTDILEGMDFPPGCTVDVDPVHVL